MFTLATYIGSYAYAILALGLLQSLTSAPILVTTITWLLVGLWLAFTRKKQIYQILECLSNDLGILLVNEPWWWIIVGLIGGSFVILLIGALGPELQHDALWYHLTLPKLYLQSGSIEFFKGDFLYYSGMPQLIEMLYVSALALTNEIGAKLIHFGFGLLTILVVVLISWPRWGIKAALLSSLLVISDLSFGWASATANIDLGRSFFELTGVYLIAKWIEKPTLTTVVKAGVVMGLALSTKYLSIASIGVMSVLIVWCGHKGQKFQSLALFLLGVGAASIAWFVRAFYYTGNPLYPLFTSFIDNSYAPNPQSLWQWLQTPFYLSFDASLWDQAISPLFVLLLPVAFIFMRKDKRFMFLSLYSFLTFGAWLLIPRTGGTRFLLPYLPIWAILVGAIFSVKPKILPRIWMQKGTFILVIMVAGFNVLISAHLHTKNIGYILGNSSKHDYLLQNLNLKGNLYDVDGKLDELLNDSDLVYVMGNSNLFYAPFKLAHESYGSLEKATHILVQNNQIPEFLLEEEPIYQDNFTGIQLFIKPK